MLDHSWRKKQARKMCETEQSYDAFKWQSENVKEVIF